MDKTPHTPEPWESTLDYIEARQYVLFLGNRNEGVTTPPAAENVANAERIVQCVNACAGIEDPAAALAAAREEIRRTWDEEGKTLARRMTGAYADDGYCTLLRFRVRRLRAAFYSRKPRGRR